MWGLHLAVWLPVHLLRLPAHAAVQRGSHDDGKRKRIQMNTRHVFGLAKAQNMFKRRSETYQNLKHLNKPSPPQPFQAFLSLCGLFGGPLMHESHKKASKKIQKVSFTDFVT